MLPSPVQLIEAQPNDMAFKLSDELIEWVYLMAYQAKLIEEGSWRIFAEPFNCFHIHTKVWLSIDSHDGLNEFI